MTSIADFRKWLWSDWGKPNFLTRAGMPKIVTNVLSYLLALYISFFLMLRLASEADRQSIRLFVRDPFVLVSWAVLYIGAVTDSYLKFSYDQKGLLLNERFRRVKKNWQDPFVRIFWISLISSMLLLLIGVFHFHRQLK
jgi:hypothetical protein